MGSGDKKGALDRSLITQETPKGYFATRQRVCVGVLAEWRGRNSAHTKYSTAIHFPPIVIYAQNNFDSLKPWLLSRIT